MPAVSFLKPDLTQEIEWTKTSALVPYEDAVQEMEERVKAIQEEQLPEKVWFLEHPPLYTLGTSADPQDVLHTDLPAFKTGRGGEVTYHGPGQRVIYVMMDLRKREKDLRAYVWSLEEWLIQSLQEMGVQAVRREGRVGLWVPESDQKDNKIAAIGVRVTKWVTYHGVALNVDPNLDHYGGIVPCGIRQHGVTSLKKLGKTASIDEVDQILKQKFQEVF